ncbi:hypothetical protein ACD661_10895 [Legionella lytica]|uniref:Uncharacterized protein n=1 Tax=Legionella lytica TaxID=96232 RepID=A0ABW8DB56_9GAMM
MLFWSIDETEGDVLDAIPNFDLLKKQDELSYARLVLLLDKLNTVSINTQLTVQELENKNFFPWLSFALGCVVKLAGMDLNSKSNSNSNLNSNLQKNSISLVMSLTQNLLNRDPDVLHAMFSKQITEGSLKGQSFAYFWMNNYYSLVVSTDDDLSTLETLDVMFHELLDVMGPRFGSLLVKNIEEGSDKGRNALLVLLRSAQLSAERMDNKLKTQLIAKLFDQCMQKAPILMGTALSEKSTAGFFLGKSCLYLLSGILLKATLHADSLSVTIIQKAILQALKSAPEQCTDALYKCYPSGLKPGLSSFHLILLSLVEAAYKDKDSVFVAQLMNLLTELTIHDGIREAMFSALLETINEGEYKGLNGFVFLCRALIAALAHHIDVSVMMDFILDVIKGAPAAQLTTAIFQSVPGHATPEYNYSPINQLISLARDANQPIQQPNAQVIIDALAQSQAQSYIRSLLPPDTQFFFVNIRKMRAESFVTEHFDSVPHEVAGASSSGDSSYGSSLRLFQPGLKDDTLRGDGAFTSNLNRF